MIISILPPIALFLGVIGVIYTFYLVLQLSYTKVLTRTQVRHLSRFTGSRVIGLGRTHPFRLTFPPRAFLHPIDDKAATGMAVY